MGPVVVNPMGPGKWRVMHPALDKLAMMMDWEEDETIERFHEVRRREEEA